VKRTIEEIEQTSSHVGSIQTTASETNETVSALTIEADSATSTDAGEAAPEDDCIEDDRNNNADH